MNPRPLKLLDLALLVATIALALGTVFTVVTLPSTLRSGGVGVDARFDNAVTAEVRRVVKDAVPTFVADLDVSATLDVPERDRDSRAVIAATSLAMLGLAWVGLLSLRRVVRSAVDGDPFVQRNVARLRLLGGSVVAAPVIAAIAERVLNATFDVAAARVEMASLGWGFFVVAALAAFALAEVFRQGSALRELDAATI